MSETVSDEKREAKIAEVERLLNDPEAVMDAHKVWALLAELAQAQPQLRARA